MASTRIKMACPGEKWAATTQYIEGIRKQLIAKGADPDAPLLVVRNHAWSGPAYEFVMDRFRTPEQKAAAKAAVLQKIMAEAEKVGLKVKVNA